MNFSLTNGIGQQKTQCFDHKSLKRYNKSYYIYTWKLFSIILPQKKSQGNYENPSMTCLLNR